MTPICEDLTLQPSDRRQFTRPMERGGLGGPAWVGNEGVDDVIRMASSATKTKTIVLAENHVMCVSQAPRAPNSP